MRRVLEFVARSVQIFVVGIIGFGLSQAVSLAAIAEEQPDAPPRLIQLKLTDDIVERFLAAQADVKPVAQKLAESAGPTVDPKVYEELNDIANRHGFSTFAGVEDVGVNVALVFDGLNQETGEFSEPGERLKHEYKLIEADTDIPAEEKTFLLKGLAKEIEDIGVLKFKSNIEVVKRYMDEVAALIAPETDPLAFEGGEGLEGEGAQEADGDGAEVAAP